MTNKEFDREYKITTGLNFFDSDWVVSHRPDLYSDKIAFFKKLVGFIKLRKNAYVGGKKVKYGRTNTDGTTSELVKTLIELIFDSKYNYDESINDLYIVNNIANVTIIKDNLYLEKTDVSNIYKAYKNNIFLGNYSIYDNIDINNIVINENTGIQGFIVLNNNKYIEYEYNNISLSYIRLNVEYNYISNSIVYLLDDNKEYILTDDGSKIII